MSTYAPKVKLCGMFRPCDLEAVAAARPDYVGFIVNFPKSHRSLTPSQLVSLLKDDNLPGHLSSATDPVADDRCPGRLSSATKKVAVFVDEPVGSVAAIVAETGLDCVQLHGHEDEDYIRDLRRVLPAGVEVIQAFRVRTPDDVEAAEKSSADLILLDNGQGTGESFDWSLVEHVSRPFMLAGGLTPENVAEAIAAVHPYGVDMSSGLETDRLKDPGKIAAAVEAVRGCASV